MSKKFIKMLQHAHAGELAAFYAYQGHWESLKDPEERAAVQWIQEEEAEHVRTIEMMLYLLKAKPSFWRDTVFTVIGKTLSYLCHFTGYFMPMYGALVIEKIGVANYQEMVTEAYRSHLPWYGYVLTRMWKTELEHEEYFKTCLKPKEGSGR